jgi:hypothetical protein
VAVSLKPAGPKVPLDSIIEPMIVTTVSAPTPAAPAKAKDAIVDSRHPAIPAELVKSERPKPTPQQKTAARPGASTAKPASSAATSSATGARTMPGKLNSNLLKTAGSIKLGAPGQPMPIPPKSVEPVTAPAEPAVTPEHVVTTEPVDTKPTMTQAEMLRRKPKRAVKTAPKRRAVITIAKEDQSAGKGIGVKYTL